MTDIERPADTMRRAAKLMRERAEVLPPPPWHAEGRDVTATQDYDGDDFDPDWDCAFNVAVCRRQDEAEHIAAMHPGLALALAGWLEMEAPNAPEIGGMVFRGGRDVHALAVACAYLGEPSILGEPA